MTSFKGLNLKSFTGGARRKSELIAKSPEKGGGRKIS